MEWKIDLTARSYFLSNTQDYFKYIFKKHETVPDNPSIMIDVNNIENRITFKIKTGYYIQLLTFETMKLLGSTKNKITNDANGENSSCIRTLHDSKPNPNLHSCNTLF